MYVALPVGARRTMKYRGETESLDYAYDQIGVKCFNCCLKGYVEGLVHMRPRHIKEIAKEILHERSV